MFTSICCFYVLHPVRPGQSKYPMKHLPQQKIRLSKNPLVSDMPQSFEIKLWASESVSQTRRRFWKGKPSRTYGIVNLFGASSHRS